MSSGADEANTEGNAEEGQDQGTGAWVDPYRAYNFKLTQQESTQVLGHFTQCAGLGVSVEAIEFREGGTTDVTRLAGQVSYSDVTLRYGLTDDQALWTWLQDVVSGKPKAEYQRNVSIVLLDTAGTGEVMRWDLIAAWPREWRGTPLDATGSELAIESITLVCDRLVRG
ncbi:MAG: phage tail protein [Deltaproteobacteria bacterium]